MYISYLVEKPKSFGLTWMNLCFSFNLGINYCLFSLAVQFFGLSPINKAACPCKNDKFT